VSIGIDRALAERQTFLVLDKSHPSTSHLPDTWHFVSSPSSSHVKKPDQKEEEVYMFRSDPRDNGVIVLISVDEGSYKGKVPYFQTNG
jgi:hypothetical protein